MLRTAFGFASLSSGCLALAAGGMVWAAVCAVKDAVDGDKPNPVAVFSFAVK